MKNKYLFSFFYQYLYVLLDLYLDEKTAGNCYELRNERTLPGQRHRGRAKMSQLDITAWTQSACEKTLTNTANIDQWRRGRSITGSTHGSRKAEDKAQDKIKLGTRQNAERGGS